MHGRFLYGIPGFALHILRIIRVSLALLSMIAPLKCRNVRCVVAIKLGRLMSTYDPRQELTQFTANGKGGILCWQKDADL